MPAVTRSDTPGNATPARASPEATVTTDPAQDLSARLRAPARRRSPSVGWLIAGALGLAAAVWQFTRPPPPPPDWVTDAATVAPLTLLVTATGTLKPLNEVTVGAEVSGRLDAILVDYNDPVQKGQVIARINTEELEARAVQARAGVTQAEANLAKAELDLERASNLRTRGFGSEEANDQARVVRDVARATLASARAARQQAEVYLEKAVIRSPIDGIVLDRKVEPGQTVAAAFQTPELFVIASDLSQLELTVDIDEADIGEVRVGQAATFTVYTYPNRTFAGRVRELRNAAKTIEKVVTYQGVLEADNGEGLLRPGMTATADIAVRNEPNAITVANRALRFVPPDSTGIDLDDLEALPPGSGRLWQVDADGRSLTPRVIQLGISDGLRTAVLQDGVRAGETFVADVTQTKRQGVSVSIGSD